MKKRIFFFLVGLLSLSLVQAQAVDRVMKIAEGIDCNYAGKYARTEADSLQNMRNISLYQEAYGNEDYEVAMKYYRKVLVKAPKSSENVAIRGVKLYGDLIETTEDSVLKESRTDTLLAMYEFRGNCYEWKPSIRLYKAFAWYKYRSDELEYVHESFMDAYENHDESMIPSIVTPWVVTMLKAERKDILTKADILDIYFNKIKPMANELMTEENAGQWQGALNKSFDYLVKYGVAGCENIRPEAEKMYNEANGDIDKLKTAYELLLTTGSDCYGEVPYFCDLVEQLNNEESTPGRVKFLANCYAKNGESQKAIDMIEQIIPETPEACDKAKLMLSAARMYKDLGSYSKARAQAQEAANTCPGFGDPYIFIGDLYVASAGMCKNEDPFLGWAVNWAAVDMYAKAKQVDPSISAEAQRKMNTYAGYFPPKEEMFFRNIQPGGSYTVGCWIQRTTTARAGD